MGNTVATQVGIIEGDAMPWPTATTEDGVQVDRAELYRRLFGVAPSVSSCHRVLQKLGLVQKRRRRVHRTATVAKATIVASYPNHIWTVDFKGWWTLAGGERCEPLTVCDAYSRYVLATIVPTTTGLAAVQQVFEQLFQEYGLPEIIRTDNGSPFAKRAGSARAEPAIGLVGQLGHRSGARPAGTSRGQSFS